MSSIRQLSAEQEPFLAVRSLATNYAGGYKIHRHQHPWHQLLFASSGAMTVSASEASWMIPTSRAVFIPARCVHAIRMWGAVDMRSLYFAPPLTGFEFGACRVVEVSSLLRELILRTVERSALDCRFTPDTLIIRLLEEEIKTSSAAAEDSPLALPMPADSRALAVGRRVLANPSARESVDDLARAHGLARRTLERRFRNETGMSFGMWRQKARLLDSIRLLADGRSVTDTALDCGYSGVSAFIAAFKGTFGYTPGRL